MLKKLDFSKIQADFKKDIQLVRLRSGEQIDQEKPKENPQEWLNKVQELLESPRAY